MRVSERRRAYGALLSLSILVACEGGNSPAPQPESGPQSAPASSGSGESAELVPGTPPGGLADWVADIKNGVQTIPAEVATDRALAQKRALDLYVGRQEFIELYYGPGGRLTAGEALGPAVKDAETRFHELLVLLSGQPPADTARVAAAVRSLTTELDRVLREAKAAGVPLVPPGQKARTASLGGGAS